MADSIGTWLGIALTLITFVVTLWQVWAARREVRGARQAVLRVEARLASNSALLLLPGLLPIETRLNAAVTARDRAQVLDALLAWRYAAGEVAGAIGASDPAMARLLEDSVREAVSCERALRESKSGVVPLCISVLTSMALATNAATRYLGRARVYTESEEDAR